MITPNELPPWLFEYTHKIEEFMESHYPGDWAIGGIQKRKFRREADLEAYLRTIANFGGTLDQAKELAQKALK